MVLLRDQTSVSIQRSRLSKMHLACVRGVCVGYVAKPAQITLAVLVVVQHGALVNVEFLKLVVGSTRVVVNESWWIVRGVSW